MADTDFEDMNMQLVDAVDEDDIEKAKCLLEKGASVDARRLHWTALMLACGNKNTAMANLLLKRGAAVNEANIEGRTALLCAAETGDVEILDLLLEHNADMTKKNNTGLTAVHFAVGNNCKTVLDRLLYFGILTVDIADMHGCTPLWRAAFYGHVDCVDILLVHGANPNHKSKRNESPLDIAQSKGHTAIVSMMTEELKSPSRQYAIGVISKLKEKTCKQDRQNDQLQKEKEQLTEDFKISGQQTEVARLTADIQRKDGQLKELSLALSSVRRVVESTRTDQQSGRPSYHPAALTRAVVHLGSDQWPLIGFQLGFNMPQMDDITQRMPGAASCLLAILEAKRISVGGEKFVDDVLAACQKIPTPIIGGVRDELDGREPHQS